MKKILALLFLCSVARAAPPVSGTGFQFSPQLSTPFAASAAGAYVKTADGLLHFQQVGGVDSSLALTIGATLTGPYIFNSTVAFNSTISSNLQFTFGNSPAFILTGDGTVGLPGDPLIVRTGAGAAADATHSATASGTTTINTGRGGAGDATHAAASSNALFIKTGFGGVDNGGGGAGTGNINIFNGLPTGSGTAGGINIGVENSGSGQSSFVNIGRSGIVTTLTGYLTPGVLGGSGSLSGFNVIALTSNPMPSLNIYGIAPEDATTGNDGTALIILSGKGSPTHVSGSLALSSGPGGASDGVSAGGNSQNVSLRSGQGGAASGSKAAGNSGDVLVGPNYGGAGTATAASGNGGNTRIVGGLVQVSSGGGEGTPGASYVDGGRSDSGVNGSVFIGTQSSTPNQAGTAAITIGRSGILTTINSDVTQSHASIGTATTTGQGILIANTTAAALGAQQYSPLAEWQGAGWGTTGSASQVTRFSLQDRPVQGTTPTHNLVMASSINGGAYGDVLTVTSTGTVFLAGSSVYYGSATNVGFINLNAAQVAIGGNGVNVVQIYNGDGITPFLDNTYTSGASNKRWSTGYFQDLSEVHTSIGTAQTVGITMQNSTAAANGAQQFAPGLAMYGQGWETTGSTNQQTGWYLQNQPVQGTTALSDLAFYSNSNGVLSKRMILRQIGPGSGTSGAKFVSSNGNSELYIDGVSARIAASTTDYLGVSYNFAHSVELVVNGSMIKFVPSVFENNVDLANGLGDSTHRWGDTFIGHDALATATTSGQGVLLTNKTAAANNAQQYSPPFFWQGQGWGTTGSASQSVEYAFQVVPVQGTTPVGDFKLWRSINGAAVTEMLKVYGNGPDGATATTVTSKNRQLNLCSGPSDDSVAGACFTASAPGGNVWAIQSGGTNYHVWTTTAHYPGTDRTIVLGQSNARYKYLYTGGTASVAGDYAPSAGFGSTASVGTITGDDTHGRFTVTATGTGQAANPTIIYTFHDGTKTTIPFCLAHLELTNDTIINTVQITQSASATALTMTFNGTPVVNDTYTVAFICIGG